MSSAAPGFSRAEALLYLCVARSWRSRLTLGLVALTGAAATIAGIVRLLGV